MGNKHWCVRVCYLLMASLFALSTCFQFNDPDWYFWIPDCIIRNMAKFAFWLGLFLFFKVAIEGFVRGTEGIWSLDMQERIVREKFGSELVIISMFLLLENSSNPNHPTHLTKYGTQILLAIAYGLSFGFFMFQHDEMRF
ncbi:hypothetical protein CDL12_07711 [Handroanthus impetiginosus]|uniref:Transmembrane protein n=1 Tax=Handroanthus impetiginosus TaxID=429701 RepID=A0A2G9HQ06_9LAMI|nr:hypothetical protein CDL12_07711 [Handroanthus impetiginosus]